MNILMLADWYRNSSYKKFSVWRNYKKEASSSLGFKHTVEAIEKMRQREIESSYVWSKHSIYALNKISKPGSLNSMFNKTLATRM